MSQFLSNWPVHMSPGNELFPSERAHHFPKKLTIIIWEAVKTEEDSVVTVVKIRIPEMYHASLSPEEVSTDIDRDSLESSLEQNSVVNFVI